MDNSIGYRHAMTTTRLGVLAFAVLGLAWILAAVTKLPFILKSGEFNTTSAAMVGLMLLGGALVFVFRVALSDQLFGSDDDQLGSMSVVDAQVAGLILLGVWIVCHEIPTIVIELAREKSRLSTGAYIALAVHAAIGLLLVTRAGSIARLWCRDV